MTSPQLLLVLALVTLLLLLLLLLLLSHLLFSLLLLLLLLLPLLLLLLPSPLLPYELEDISWELGVSKHTHSHRGCSVHVCHVVCMCVRVC